MPFNFFDGTEITARRLPYQRRKGLPDSSFALPEERKYPINDENHARNALTRVSQFGSPAEQKRVRSAVRKRFPGIKVTSSDVPEWVVEAARNPYGKSGLPDDRKMEIINHYLKGRSVADIKHHTGHSVPTIYKVLKEVGEKFSRGARHTAEATVNVGEPDRRNKIPEHKHPHVVSQYTKHKRSIQTLANVYGVGTHHIRNILSENGVEIRGRGRLALRKPTPMITKKGPKIVSSEHD